VQPAPPPKPGFGPLPDPPALTEGELTVNDAWALFGIAKKRATKDEVKRRYLEFVFKHHPDRNLDSPEAQANLTRANLALALLQKHCRWV
jgi:hypothetical protein